MDNAHAKYIDAWIARATPGLSQKELIALFDRAIQALWNRSLTPLSEVTLTAIFERVLNSTQKKFPLLTHISLVSNRVVIESLNGKASDLSIAEIKEAFGFFLTELLSLLAILTADLLTPAFYSELSKVVAQNQRKEARDLKSVKPGAEGRHHE